MQSDINQFGKKFNGRDQCKRKIVSHTRMSKQLRRRNSIFSPSRTEHNCVFYNRTKFTRLSDNFHLSHPYVEIADRSIYTFSIFNFRISNFRFSIFDFRFLIVDSKFARKKCKRFLFLTIFFLNVPNFFFRCSVNFLVWKGKEGQESEEGERRWWLNRWSYTRGNSSCHPSCFCNTKIAFRLDSCLCPFRHIVVATCQARWIQRILYVLPETSSRIQRSKSFGHLISERRAISSSRLLPNQNR